MEFKMSYKVISKRSIDKTPPKLSITSDKSRLRAGESANITFRFTEVAHDFSLSDIITKNGSISALSPTKDNKVFTAVFTPINDLATGSASISIAKGSYTDAAKNQGVAVSFSKIKIDSLAPTLKISSNKALLKTGDTAVLTFSFSEVPVGFTLEDITTSHGVASNLKRSADPKIFTATFTPNANLGNANASISVSAGAYSDAAGNVGTSTNSVSLAVDTRVFPKMSITSDDSVINQNQSTKVIFKFSQLPANNFTMNDISVSNGSLENLQISSDDPKVYTATFRPSPSSKSGLTQISVSNWNDSQVKQSQTQYLWVSDTVESRINPAYKGHFQTNFYSSTGAAINGVEQLSTLGGIGPDYGGNKFFSTDTWTKLQKQGLHTPYLFKFPGIYTAENNGPGFSATPQEIYDAFYDQAKKAIQDTTQHQVVSSWYMPEEMRPWVANDMGAIRKAVLAIRDAETELNVAATVTTPSQVGLVMTLYGAEEVVRRSEKVFLKTTIFLSGIEAIYQLRGPLIPSRTLCPGMEQLATKLIFRNCS